MPTENQFADPDESRRKLIIIVVAIFSAVVIAIVIALFLYVGRGRTPATLEGAIRAGSPEFAASQTKIVLDKPEAYESKQALGGIVMNLDTIAHNFTGRTLSGLEIKGTVVDHQGKPVKQLAVVVLPNIRQTELENNRSMPVRVTLDGMTDKDDRANIQIEVTGFRFK
jgi:hypothetical protein